jgi:hypothetical protein
MPNWPEPSRRRYLFLVVRAHRRRRDTAGHRANPYPPRLRHGATTGAETGVWGEVWIQVSDRTWSTLLRQRRPDPGGGWGRVLDEIATRLATTRAGPPNGDPTARLPGRALRRWIAVRDRRCPFPGCQMPAHRGEADHSRQHARGGPTLDTNLTLPCPSHHRLRDHGWRLHHHQHRPGHVRWTSRLGHLPPPTPARAGHPARHRRHRPARPRPRPVPVLAQLVGQPTQLYGSSPTSATNSDTGDTANETPPF